MAATITLRLITPERIVFENDKVSQVVAKSTDGELAIMPGHEPLVTPLSIDVIRFVVDGEEEHAAVMGGVLEVRENSVTVLSDVAELGEEIDHVRASSAKERLEAEKMTKTDKLDVYATEMAISRAITRLKAVELRTRRRRPMQ